MAELREESLRALNSLLKGRAFQLWEYRVSHGELLVRSPKDRDHPTNIDILIVDALYVALPRYLRETQLRAATAAEVEWTKAKLGTSVERAHIIVFETPTSCHLVVGTLCGVRENEMEIFQSPFPE